MVLAAAVPPLGASSTVTELVEAANVAAARAQAQANETVELAYADVVQVLEASAVDTAMARSHAVGLEEFSYIAQQSRSKLMDDIASGRVRAGSFMEPWYNPTAVKLVSPPSPLLASRNGKHRRRARRRSSPGIVLAGATPSRGSGQSLGTESLGSTIGQAAARALVGPAGSSPSPPITATAVEPSGREIAVAGLGGGVGLIHSTSAQAMLRSAKALARVGSGRSVDVGDEAGSSIGGSRQRSGSGTGFKDVTGRVQSLRVKESRQTIATSAAKAAAAMGREAETSMRRLTWAALTTAGSSVVAVVIVTAALATLDAQVTVTAGLVILTVFGIAASVAHALHPGDGSGKRQRRSIGAVIPVGDSLGGTAITACEHQPPSETIDEPPPIDAI